MPDYYCVQLEPPQDPAVIPELVRRLADALELSEARAGQLLEADTLILDEREARAVVAVCRSLKVSLEIRRQGRRRHLLERPVNSDLGQMVMLCLAGAALVFAIVAFTFFDRDDLSFALRRASPTQPPEATRAQEASLLAAGPAAVEAVPLLNIFTAAKSQGVAEVRAALTAGTDVNRRDSLGQTPLMYAAAANRLEVVRALLESGASPNMQSNSGRTPLMLAVESNPDPAVITLLLEAGSDLAARTDEGRTVVDLALARGGEVMAPFANRFLKAAREADPGEIRRLLDLGFRADVRDAYGQTPLMYAVQNSVGAVTTLLEAGAQANARSAGGWTALMFAARHNPDPAVAQALLEAGADPTLRNTGGQTARDIALEHGNEAVLRILESVVVRVAQAGNREPASASAMTVTPAPVEPTPAVAVDSSNSLESTRTVLLLCLQDWTSCGSVPEP